MVFGYTVYFRNAMENRIVARSVLMGIICSGYGGIRRGFDRFAEKINQGVFYCQYDLTWRLENSSRETRS